MSNKRNILLFLLGAFLLIICSFAPKPENRLTGIWELQMEGASTGLLKIFNKDGSFTNIGLGDNGFGISAAGTYELQSANSYLEKITVSSYKDQQGTQKEVRFQITGDSTLHIAYTISGTTYNEDYKRLTLIKGQ
ncbi:hypothetical protein A8C56_22155 [Niabella ginsenosidivorans]|uniref:DUF4488 domain-containing protein n=1 Tax=Niabella ginsenosidivorans TaxID=1176587 RepID=A0A1A9I9V8_9BACT|nr:DUF4488 domain-containing protein [Niabella ginsenosidivorans]ANH83324.1 hypothetical protein A8C56_22155 [Niabella ginsenosidivorans]